MIKINSLVIKCYMKIIRGNGRLSVKSIFAANELSYSFNKIAVLYG